MISPFLYLLSGISVLSVLAIACISVLNYFGKIKELPDIFLAVLVCAAYAFAFGSAIFLPSGKDYPVLVTSLYIVSMCSILFLSTKVMEPHKKLIKSEFILICILSLVYISSYVYSMLSLIAYINNQIPA